MILRRQLLVPIACALIAGLSATTSYAKDKKVRPAPPPPDDGRGPTELVHVPTEEMDVLLRADRRGIVLRYAEYQRLMKAAKARAEALEALPPVDGTLVSCRGKLDLTGEDAATMQLDYVVEVLADGPRSVAFPLRNFALEQLLVQDADGAVSGRYEEWKGRPRLRFESPGRRTVTARASAAFLRKGAQRYLDLQLPPASAMSVALRFPAGVEGVVIGEGPAIPVRARSDEPLTVHARPSRGGRLRIAFAPSAKGTEDGPPILDTLTNALHTVGDGLINTRVVVHVDVFRSPVDRLTLQVPADLSVRALEGNGVTGFRRSADATRLTVQLAKRVLGPVIVTLEGERPYRPGDGVALPHVLVGGSVRDRALMAVQFGRDVRVRGFRVTEGRRLPASRAKGQQHLLRYELTRESGTLAVDLAPGAVRLDAVSTYYLNLAEAGKTLIATTTYRVLEGTVFALRPRMPGGYELRTVTINGRPGGFNRDLRPDGTLEIALARGVPAGGEISLAATLEQAQADWVADGQPVRVPFAVPAAGATREEGLVAIGADAAFRVLEAAREDLVAVGAAELTARGISAAGLVYGYRLDGPKPAVTFNVQRHEPLLEASVVTTLLPSPRRLDVLAVVAHRIQRAGVRVLLVDVPAWAEEDQVRFESPFVRGAVLLKGEEKPADVPAGYERWRVDLNQRVIGRHATVVRYHDDLADENWSVPADRALGVRAPLEGSERYMVVQRADGLEVRVVTEGADIRAVELTELPAAAAVDPRLVLEALRLTNGAEGVGVSVQKHSGAAVLDAVATQVQLETAVAREGVLRTRAEVHLFNVDRQFLRVSLPPGSDLVGAVVGNKAVKVLTDPSGVMMVPIPTARARGEITVATLTYDTKLEDGVGGTVRVPSPVFHDLEVLQTSHRVAFDPDFEITSVGGDYGKISAAALRRRTPWIVTFLGAFTLGGGGGQGFRLTGDEASGPVGRNHSEFMSPVDFSSLQQNPILADPSSRPDAGQEVMEELEEETRAEWLARRTLHEKRRARDEVKFKGPAGAEPPGLREPSDPTPTAPPPPTGAPQADGPPSTPAASAAAKPRRAGAPRPAPKADPRGGGRSDADEFHEGDMPADRGRGRRGPRGRRKGLLSLDVPVVLGPNVVVARRLGQGGTVEIGLATRESSDHRFHLITLVLFAVGLLAGTGSGARKWLVILGGSALAVLVHLLLGPDGNTLAVALANAVTILALAWSVRWLAAKWMNRGTHPKPVEKAAAAAVVVLAFCLGSATPAHADEPRPPVPNVKTPRKVFVPYDPAKASDVKPSDRVFLPLDTYLRLFKAAHPELDPELVKLGRMVTIVEAAYRVDVVRDGGDMASGSARWRFAKRGRGMLLVAWPVAGLAVTEATLDGEPVRLLLDKGVYRIAVSEPGDHRLELRFKVPVVAQPDGRHFSFQVPPFARAALNVEALDFDGDVRVSGAGRVQTAYESTVPGRRDCKATAWLGRRRRITVRLLERAPEELPATVRTRAESRAIHSIRDAGTETQTDLTLYVLQGRAPFVDLALPDGVTVLEAKGPRVVRWEVLAQPAPRVRLVLNAPATGALKLSLRTFRAAGNPERIEDLPDLAVLNTTGESGQLIVNADPGMRVDIRQTENLFRIGRPNGKGMSGVDGRGRVTGAWRFAARPSRLQVGTRRIASRVDIDSDLTVLFGDDRVRSTIAARLVVDTRAAVGTLVFHVPGEDKVRDVASPGMDTWWIEGAGETRRLHVRYRDMRTGTVQMRVWLERRLGGRRDGLTVPRFALDGARRDRGRLALYALMDVELRTGSIAGLRPLPPANRPPVPPDAEGARLISAYAWDSPIAESLPVGLRDPELETEATVVSVVAPGDEEHRIEHLVIFEVRRGSTDHLRLFVPDGSAGERAARGDVVTTRDVREMRRERVTRKDADGADVAGTLYDIRLQSVRDGVIEVTVSQTWRSTSAQPRPVRLVRPEGVSTTHWFSLVRTFLDGKVDVALLAGKADTDVYESLPFVPAELQPGDVFRSYAAREPYILLVNSQVLGLEAQAAAVVQSADATVVLGRDGQARIRVDYRVFNRSRQFLRIRLPDDATLFGATTNRRPVKPLAGAGRTILLPIQKVPLGGNGYPVSVLYRTRAGADLDEGKALRVLLPDVVDGVEVDRTVVRLYVPHGYDYDFESSMTASDAEDVAADLAGVAIREARSLLQLADQGTLHQRFNASQNGLQLIAHARARLAKNGRVQHRYRALVGELNQLGEQLGSRNEEVQRDVAAARRERRQSAPSVEEFASNARNFIRLDDVTNGMRDEARARGVVADKNKAGWVVNPSKAAEGKKSPGKERYKQLQERLAKGLKTRADRERRKGRQALDPGQTKNKPQGGKSSTRMEAPEQVFDLAQVAWLNDALKQEQVRNRQLGAVDTSLLNVMTVNGRVSDAQLLAGLLSQSEAQAGQALQLGRRAQSASNYGLAAPQTAGAGGGGAGQQVDFGYTDATFSGAYFEDSKGDRAFSARTENVFDGELAAALGKVGKMGVDVQLPLTGTVYYFRSMSGGAPIQIEASRSGRSTSARVFFLLLIIAAAAVGGTAVRRKMAAAA